MPTSWYSVGRSHEICVSVRGGLAKHIPRGSLLLPPCEGSVGVEGRQREQQELTETWAAVEARERAKYSTEEARRQQGAERQRVREAEARFRVWCCSPPQSTNEPGVRRR